MEPVTVSITEEHVELLAELSGDGTPCKNRSEAMRMIIDQYNETKGLRIKRDRLREQLAATNRRVDEHVELQEYVRSQQELERRRARAGAVTRAKWWMFGMSDEGQEREREWE